MKGIIIVFLFLFITSCANDLLLKPTTCNVDFPLENLIWLREIRSFLETETSSNKKQIVQYTYKDETIFLVDNCKDCADNLTKIYNCNGNVICEFGGIAGINTCKDFDKKAIIDFVLWKN